MNRDDIILPDVMPEGEGGAPHDGAYAACGFVTPIVTSMSSFRTASLLRPYSALCGIGCEHATIFDAPIAQAV